jgi:hypothetical protein
MTSGVPYLLCAACHEYHWSLMIVCLGSAGPCCQKHELSSVPSGRALLSSQLNSVWNVECRPYDAALLTFHMLWIYVRRLLG